MKGISMLAPVYDRLTAPLEHRALACWRTRAWERVPAEGPGLEIGVGTGANFRHHPPGVRVAAVDVSPAMLRRARKKPERGGASLVAADVQALPFPDGAFAWAVATLVFCEVPNPAAGLREVRRVLAPGGTLVLLEHVRPGGWLGTVADVVSAASGPIFGERFDRDTAAAVREAGFELESRELLWRDAVVLLGARKSTTQPRRGESGWIR